MRAKGERIKESVNVLGCCLLWLLQERKEEKTDVCATELSPQAHLWAAQGEKHNSHETITFISHTNVQSYWLHLS